MKNLVVRKCFFFTCTQPSTSIDGTFSSGWHIVAVFGYYFLFVCLFDYFFSKMAPEKKS